MSETQFVSVKEVAETLGVSNPTVCRWINEGLVPAINICRKNLIPATWLKKQLEKANEQLEKINEPK